MQCLGRARGGVAFLGDVMGSALKGEEEMAEGMSCLDMQSVVDVEACCCRLLLSFVVVAFCCFVKGRTTTRGFWCKDRPSLSRCIVIHSVMISFLVRKGDDSIRSVELASYYRRWRDRAGN